jgi:hypothetical protein
MSGCSSSNGGYLLGKKMKSVSGYVTTFILGNELNLHAHIQISVSQKAWPLYPRPLSPMGLRE